MIKRRELRNNCFPKKRRAKPVANIFNRRFYTYLFLKLLKILTHNFNFQPPDFNFCYLQLVCADCGLQLVLNPDVDDETFTRDLYNCLVAVFTLWLHFVFINFQF
jgi:hypothetical protein